jgi:hypothetical protein
MSDEALSPAGEGAFLIREVCTLARFGRVMPASVQISDVAPGG